MCKSLQLGATVCGQVRKSSCQVQKFEATTGKKSKLNIVILGARVQIANCGSAEFPVKASNSVCLFSLKDDYIIFILTAAYLHVFERIGLN